MLENSWSSQVKFNASGTFLNPDKEVEYRLATWDEFSYQWRVPITYATLVYVFAGITDYLSLGLSLECVISVGLRFTVLGLIIFIGQLTQRVQKIQLFEILIFIVEVLVVSHLLWSTVVKTDQLFFHLAGALVFTFVIYIFIPNRLSIAMLAGGSLGLGTLIVASTTYQTSLRELVSFSILFFATNMLGIFEKKRLRKLRRQEYHKSKNLENEVAKRNLAEQNLLIAKANLETAVETRTAELQTAKNRLNDVVDNLSDWIWEVGPDLTLTYVSDRYFHDYNIKKEEAIGSKSWTKISEEWLEKNHQAWEAHKSIVAAHKSFKNFEAEAVDGQGRRFNFETSGKAIFDDKGNFKGYRGATTDITQQKIAEQKRKESEERFKWILNISPVGLGVSNIETGKILFGNSELAKLYGMKQEDLIGFNAKNIWKHPDERVAFVKTFKEHGFVPQQEAEALRIDGSSFWCLISWHKFIFEGKNCVLFWLVDIDELKKTELKLFDAKTEAEDASRAKSQFLAQMSHELRTPLNAIIGFADAMRSQVFGPIGNQNYAEYVEHIHHSGRNLLGLIEEILDLSKIEAGKMELLLQDVEITNFLEDVVNSTSSLAQKNNNTLITNIKNVEGVFSTDVGKLRQILLNLLSNAYKFTENGTVEFTVDRVTHGAKEALVFVVTDTGRGIAQGDLNNLFTDFHRSDSMLSASVEGAGLGLAISRRLAEFLEGEITVQSEVGKGSSFTLSIPANQIN